MKKIVYLICLLLLPSFAIAKVAPSTEADCQALLGTCSTGTSCTNGQQKFGQCGVTGLIIQYCCLPYTLYPGTACKDAGGGTCRPYKTSACNDDEYPVGECDGSHLIGSDDVCCKAKNTIPGFSGFPSDITASSSLSSSSASLAYTPLESIPGQGRPTDFPAYIKALYSFGIFSVGIAGLLMVMVGGFYYVTAAGNSSQVEKGKEFIKDALIGVVVAFGSWLILYVINPDLVNINLDSLTKLRMAAGGMTYGPTPGGSGGAQITGTCKDLNPDLTNELNAAATQTGVPATLLASFMRRECAPAMSNPRAALCMNNNTSGAGGAMQFTDATWASTKDAKGNGCSGSKFDRQSALVCAGKKIYSDSNGDFSEAGIRKAAAAYCGACNDSACGGNDYCTGIVNNYSNYASCSTTS